MSLSQGDLSEIVHVEESAGRGVRRRTLTAARQPYAPGRMRSTRARKLEDASIPSVDVRMKQFCLQQLEPLQRSRFIITHQARIAHDVGSKYGGQPALQGVLPSPPEYPYGTNLLCRGTCRRPQLALFRRLCSRGGCRLSGAKRTS
jgi:hypothetical protein